MSASPELTSFIPERLPPDGCEKILVKSSEIKSVSFLHMFLCFMSILCFVQVCDLKYMHMSFDLRSTLLMPVARGEA